jgi:hypothetical protein
VGAVYGSWLASPNIHKALFRRVLYVRVAGLIHTIGGLVSPTGRRS